MPISRLAVAAALMCLASGAQAGTITHNLAPFTGDPAEVQITLNDDVANQVKFTVQVTGPVADIRGVFFDILGGVPAGLAIVGGDITAVDTGGVCKAGSNSNNLNGGGSPCDLDVGVEIGSNGMGRDDIQMTMFTVTSAAGLSLADFAEQDLGVRLTSVDIGSGRIGSSKLTRVPVPEPSSTLLFAAGALVVGQGLRGRKR